MANRNFASAGKYWSMHVYPVQLDCQITIGASGAVSSFTGKGINAVTRLATGQYRIQLQDNYTSLLQIDGSAVSPITGSAVTAGSFTTGTAYQIVTVGTTNYTAIGLAPGLVAAPGLVFVATGAGTGTGTALAIGNSGISSVEQVGNSASMLQNPAFVQGLQNGGYINFQTLAPTSSSSTVSIPANPANGSVIKLIIVLNNSSVQ